VAQAKDLVPKGADWIPRKLADLERQIAELRSARRGESTGISRGGITLTDDSFLRMVSDADVEVVYIGPDEDGKQIFRLRRENGAGLLRTGTAGSNNFWALTDNQNRVIFSDDAIAGKGMARPWLPVVLYPQFVPNGAAGTLFANGYPAIPATALATEQVVWKGRAPISHPWLTVVGVFGQASGTTLTVVYRIKFYGTEVATWTVTDELQNAFYGPFDMADYVGDDWESIELTAQVTASSGSPNVALGFRGAYLHQS
jgi:hypothetical protein